MNNLDGGNFIQKEVKRSIKQKRALKGKVFKTVSFPEK
jgi:hypothetical protein